MKRNFKLWHRIALVALTGTVPMVLITVYVISTSINKDIAFGVQEMKGNTYQRPLEKLLNLLPQHQAVAREALAGETAAKNQLAQLQQQVDQAFGDLGVVQRELGAALKFTDAELAARKRENANLSVVMADWQKLKGATLEVAASDEATGKLVAAIRTMITHAGDTSNLILDPDLDSYYLMDVTLCALPQTQDRLSSITLQVGDWLLHHQVATNKTDIAVMAAMLRQSDQDRITGDIQTTLSEDKNFYGLSPSLQKNLPTANDHYVAANQALLTLLDRVVDGENLPDSKAFAAAGWAARDASFRLWETGVTELDGLLATRVADYRHRRLLSYASIAGVLALVALVIWRIVRKLNLTLRGLAEHLQETSGQVSAAANGIASASQVLAEGASEQAASLEETSAALEEISSMTQRNAHNVQSAKDFTAQTRTTAESCARSTHEMGQAMQGIKAASAELHEAMHGIKAASNDVSKIIKTIDEIAFQTNILALNAAVEAARAGEAGMGFAVVADEVRTLAQRSATASRETADMIAASIKRSDDGVRVTDKVFASVEEVATKSQDLEQKLAAIVAKAQEVDEQVAQIASASQEQKQGISEVNIAVSQMDKVTQSNAGNAEESATAAEELNTQAEVLTDAVRELQQLVGSSAGRPTDQPQTKIANPPSHQAKPHHFQSRPKAAAAHRSPTPATASVTKNLDFPMPEAIGAGTAKNGFKDF